VALLEKKRKKEKKRVAVFSWVIPLLL